MDTISSLQKALELQNSGDYLGAQNIYISILNQNPLCADAWNLFGVLAISVGDYKKGVEFIKEALKIDTKNSNYLINLAEAYKRLEEIESSIEILTKVLKDDAKNQTALYNLANCYKLIEKFTLCSDLYKRAIELNSKDIDAKFNLANLYAFHLKKESEAIELYLDILKDAPEFESATINLAYLYTQKGSIEKAINLLNKKCHLNSADIFFNLANNLKSIGDVQKAIEFYKKAIERRENFKEAHINLSFAYLEICEFKLGFLEYEHRRDGDSSYLEFSKDIKEKRVFIYHEQGFGDTIMFLVFLDKLKSLAKSIYFLPQKELKGICKDAKSEIPKKSEYDVALPLGSLPYVLGIESISDIPKRAMESFYKKRKYRVGLSWCGNIKFIHTEKKSIPLCEFKEILNLPGFEFYSLQYGAKEEIERVGFKDLLVDLGSGFRDFSDTKEAILGLDFVISIDCVVAHLCGHLGKRCYLLLHNDPDWRWQREGDSSYWYESIKIIRESEYGSFKNSLELLKFNLLELLKVD